MTTTIDKSHVTNHLRVGDVVAVEPHGDCPTHYCRITSFKHVMGLMFAMGDWYSKKGNYVKSTGFDINVVRKATELDLAEIQEAHRSFAVDVIRDALTPDEALPS